MKLLFANLAPPWLRFLLLGLVLFFVLFGVGGLLEALGVDTNLDLGANPGLARKLLLASMALFVPILLVVPKLDDVLYLDEENRRLVLVRRGLAFKRTQAVQTDEAGALVSSPRRALWGTFIDVELALADGRSVFLFSVPAQRWKAEGAGPSIAETLGVEQVERQES